MSARPTLAERLAALERARVLARDRLEPDERNRLEGVHRQATQRLAQGADAVVVALGGGTGSGKSSLYNALTMQELAEVGVLRPVTSEARAAAVGDPVRTGVLLDWLGVRRRDLLPAGDGLADGLVLVDLPDHDSVATDHRLVVDRFVARVDVLVWVVDPRKYAQRSLHAAYLRSLATHAEVTVVVLNRIDELTPGDRDTVRDDLAGLLAAEGLGAARLLTTSATTGEGVDELRELLRREVETRHAVAARIAADVTAVTTELREAVGAVPGDGPTRAPELVSAMGEAVGVSGLADDAHRAYRQDARAATRPRLTGAVLALLALLIRPLRRWRSERTRRRSLALRGSAGPLPVGVRHALLSLVESVAGGAAPRWRERLRRVAEHGGDRLAAALTAELERIPLTPRRRRWWAPVALLWTLVEVVATVGLTWLTATGVLAWLQLPPLPSPDVGLLPLPTLLLLGGTACWLLFAAVRRSAVDRGARRHRRRLREQVEAELHERAHTSVIEPLAEETSAIRALDAALAEAGRSGLGGPPAR